MDNVEFEWDEVKAETNRRIHKVDFLTASLIFDNALFIQSDPYEEGGEWRFNAPGKVGAAVLVVTYTSDWVGDTEWIRIISARAADSAQRRRYEQS